MLPCGAYVQHDAFGIGQISAITLSFKNKQYCEYTYLKDDIYEFTIMPNGYHIMHQSFGIGTVIGYKVAFKDSEVHFSLDDFQKKTIKLVTKMESD